MALESRMAATNRRRPPQSGHCSTSMSSPRRISSTQVRLCESTTFFEVLADGDPLTDGRRVECVQWRRLRFIEDLAGVVAQQAPSHEQAQDSRSNDAEQGVDFLVRGRFGGCEGKRAIPLSHEHPVDRQRVEVHVQVQRATKALDDRDRTSAAVAMTRCAGSLSVEALQGTRVDREHRAAEAVVPSKPIAKLEGKAQYPLSNRGPREHVVDEMRRALGHPAAAAARAEAAAFAGERNQPIGATVSTAKPGKPMREHAAAHESLELALHEQRARRTYERKIVSLVAAVQGSTARERHQDSCRCQPLRFQRVSERSPRSDVANGVGTLAAATFRRRVATGTT